MNSKIKTRTWSATQRFAKNEVVIHNGVYFVAISANLNQTPLTSPTIWRNISGMLSASAALNFPSIAAVSQADLTIAVVGAKVNDTVFLGLPAAPTAGIVFNAFVSAADVVTVRATNVTAGAIDPVSATYRVDVKLH